MNEMLSSGSIFKHYEILEIIGHGGMGVVYKARDIHLERIVALKLIDKQYTFLTEYRAKLALEARLAARIDSVYVVKIWEFSEYDGLPYISYEYVPGKDLREVMKLAGFKEKLKYSQQLAEGLASAHKLGVIHRDLKPENIKITDAGEVKILDFGLAKIISPDSVNQQGQIEGTLHYMSPEQVSGLEMTFSTDIFSFGVILYELFTGQKPFYGEYSSSIIYSILHEDPRTPSELDPVIPPWTDYIITRLLQKNPKDRFSDMQKVCDLLRNVHEQKAVEQVIENIPHRQKNVNVIDIKNLSGDSTWDYFCVGFTEDLIREISKRTDLIISSEPATSVRMDVKEVFMRTRADYIITGSLMKWKNTIRLSLNIFRQEGNDLIYDNQFEGEAQQIFQLLAGSARSVSEALAEVTGSPVTSTEDYLATDISAYDYYLKGRNYYHTSKEEELNFAVCMFTRALELDENFALAHTGLSDVYAFQYNAYYDRKPERIEQAKREALKALELKPLLPEAHRSLGRCYMFIGAYEEAEKEFLKAIEINPKFSLGYRTEAWLKLTLGDLNTALLWAKKALQLAPTDLETLLLISLIYLDQKKYTLAMATLQRAIEIGPDYGRAYYNLGTVYSKLGVFDLALENFLLAIKYQGDPNSYIDAGYTYLINGMADHAIDMLNNSIEADHLPFIASYYLGLLEKKRGNLEGAGAHYRKALESIERFEKEDPQNPHLLSYKALILAAIGKDNEAVEIINSLLPHCQESGDILYTLARACALLGNYHQTGTLLNQSLEQSAGPTKKEIAVDPHFDNLEY